MGQVEGVELTDSLVHLMERDQEQSKLRNKSSLKYPKQQGSNPEDKMKNTDKSRKWMWWGLGIFAALQLYFVRELVAVFALFAVGFAAIAFVIMGLYMMH